MKRTVRKGIALLLCLCMALTLLPVSVFALVAEDWAVETPTEAAAVEAPATLGTEKVEEVPAEADAPAETLGLTVLTDGITDDNWAQDPATVAGTGAICEKTASGLHLKAGSDNSNYHRAGSGGPAVFINSTANAAIQASDDDPKFIEVTFAPTAGDNASRFGVFLRYTNPGEGFYLGCTSSGWYWESLGTGGSWSSTVGSGPTVGQPNVLRMEWSGTTMTKAVFNGEVIFTNINMTSNGAADTVAIRMPAWDNTAGECYISEFHYSGQATKEVGGPGEVVDGKLPVNATTNADWDKLGDKGTTSYNAGEGYRDFFAAFDNGTGADAALFASNKLSTAVYGDTDNDKFLSITLEPARNADFGVYVNYGANTTEGVYIGHNETDGWYWKKNGVSQATGLSADWSLGQEYVLYIAWNNATARLSASLNGKTLLSEANITDATTGTKVVVSCGGANDEDTNRTQVLAREIYHNNQETINVYTVSGTVKLGGTTPLAGVTVSIGNLKTVTDAQGEFTLELVPGGAQSVYAKLYGYGAEPFVIENLAANKSDVAITMVKHPVISGAVTSAATVINPVDNHPVAGALIQFKKGEIVVAEGTTNNSGAYSIPVPADTGYTVVMSAAGYATKTKESYDVSADTENVNFATEESLESYHVLSTAGMDVLLSKTFPQVVQYRMKTRGELNGKAMLGQQSPLTTVKINGVEVTPKVASALDSGSKFATYTLTLDNTNCGSTGVNAVIHVKIAADLEDVNRDDSAYKANTLGFYITDVVYPGADAAAQKAAMLAHPVMSIEIPNLSLVSVNSDQTGAGFAGGKGENSSIATNDKFYTAATDTATGNEDFLAAMIYNENLAAGVSGNSDVGGGSAGAQNYPVRLTRSNNGGVETYALASPQWNYNYDLSNSHPSGDDSHDFDALVSTGDDGVLEGYDKVAVLNEGSNKRAVYIPDESERPWVKVVIADDANEDATVDWQDAAIALRETVMHLPANSEMVKEMVNLRISMNFGSMAQNPFLIALDNVKRVAAHTDGLGQMVLLKGYANEGHDSGHPNYGDVGVRLGGAADMSTLIREGKELGAYFGIHVNASELYPEAEAMSDAIVRRNTDHSLHYGWNWLDQGIAFSSLYDFGTGRRDSRWDDLWDAVGADGKPKQGETSGLNFVYVDVWGNNTGGTEDSWMTRRLSNEITSHGWAIAHEWSYANPYESTFQHWTTDYTYGNYADKGKNNSVVMRFLLNSYRNSFPPDFATFGGACNSPLLGGPAMQGFEGWQGDAEYDLSIYNTYNQMVATKFLQHYDIMSWETSPVTVTIPYSANANGARGTDASWTPETRIVLKGNGQTVAVTRGSTGDVPTYEAGAQFGGVTEAEYRSRVITLDGKVILKGAAASAGEDQAFPAESATLQYLIPWYWNNVGETVPTKDEKLYHWNALGGKSTWEVPDSWNDLSTVVVYELSDQGRDAGKTVAVVADGDSHTITINAKANTPYVVVRGTTGAAAPAITYGTGLFLNDPSFNLDVDANSPWEVSGTGAAVRTTSIVGISVLKTIGQVSVTQEIGEGLTAGDTYVAYVAVDNRSTAKAHITITDVTDEHDPQVVATNYTGKSIAKNYISAYYLHNNRGVDGGSSYFQNMYVYFTPKAGHTYTLTLSREAGAGATYWDDIRIVRNGYDAAAGHSVASPLTFDDDGNVTRLEQDFEDVPQGMWPFVVGPVEGVNDNRQHLSQLNAPYTQAGWDVKKLDDVIDGEWSVKVNGLAGSQNLIMQTIPQTFRFEPGVTYVVEFDYEMGSEGAYLAAVGEGEYTFAGVSKWVTLEKTLEKTLDYENGDYTGSETAKATVAHAKFTVTGAESGQTWIGIYSAQAPTYPAAVTSNNERAFGGYKDFVLDNLVIARTGENLTALTNLVDKAGAMVETNYLETDDGDWEAMQTALAAAEAVLADEDATDDQITAAYNALNAAVNKLTEVVVSISGTVTGVAGPVEGATVTLEDGRTDTTNTGESNQHYTYRYDPIPGHVTTTDAQGRFTFTSTAAYPLAVQNYEVKVQATGYNVKTISVTGITPQAPNKTGVAVELDAEAPGAYVNDFNNGDVSMMGYLVPDDTEGLPTFEAVEYGGSGALQITWNANSGETRHINNVVDKSMSFQNGTMSFDVTPLSDDGLRFGVTFRGQMGTAANANRVFVGQEDAAKKWFVEYWGDSTGYSTVEFKDIGLKKDVTRNVRVDINGNNFSVYVDGIRIYQVTYSVPSAAGYAGFNMRNNAGTQYIIDNLRIVSADASASGSHTVAGTVKCGDDPIPGASVLVLNEDGEQVTSTTTNAAGAYRTTELAPGEYTLRAEADFYNSDEKSITVASADLTDQNMTLAVDTSKLQTLVTACDELTQADYTEATWTPFAAALAAAKEVLEDQTPTVADMSAAYNTLSEAKSGLEPAASLDLSGLREAYAEYAAKVRAAGTSDQSWNAFQDKLAQAYDVLQGKTEATQSEVTELTAAIAAAYNALEVGASLSAAVAPGENNKTVIQLSLDNGSGKNITGGCFLAAMYVDGVFKGAKMSTDPVSVANLGEWTGSIDITDAPQNATWQVFFLTNDTWVPIIRPVPVTK